MKWVKAAALILLCVLFLWPLYWMIVGSFSSMLGIMKLPPDFFPSHPTLENYARVMAPGWIVLRWFGNSLLITVSGVLLTLVTMGAAAYSLTVYRLRWTRAIYLAFAATMMVSRYSLLIPLFVLVKTYHLGATLGVILTGVFYPLGFFLLYNFMRMIPRDFLESARIDGAGEWRVLFQIMLPLCKPALGAVMAFKMMDTFGDYIWQQLLLQGERERSYIVGIIYRIYEEYMLTRLNNYGVGMAAGVMVFLPLLVIFLFSNRYFIEGITLGGVKE